MFQSLIFAIALLDQPATNNNSVSTTTEPTKALPTWTQWRGNDRDGLIKTNQEWPAKLTAENFKKIWAAENLGPSYSGPLVLNDKVITTATVDKKDEVVTAFDRSTGKQIWQTKWNGSMTVPFFAAKNGSWIRATPVADDDTVYVAGICDVLVAIELSTGKEKWRLDFVQKLKTPKPDFGFVCSPLVDQEAIYVQAGGAFQKINKKSGEIIWSSLKGQGGMMGSAFSSPTFASIAGQEQIIVQTREELAGVEKANGKVLWQKKIPSFRGMNILTPIAIGDAVFTSTYGGTTQLLEIKPTSADKNAPVTANSAWSLKYEGNMTTPVIIKEHAYFLGKDRKAICVNTKTGKEGWRSEKTFGEYWSMVANGDQILALDNRGILFLIKANPKELTIESEFKVSDSETWAHIAVAGNEIIIRDLNQLTSFQWK